MATEWRLVVDKRYGKETYPKRDQAHAAIGKEHAERDFKRYDDIGMEWFKDHKVVSLTHSLLPQKILCPPPHMRRYKKERRAAWSTIAVLLSLRRFRIILPPCLLQGAPQQELYLPVQAAKVVVRPALHSIKDLSIHPQ